MGMDCGSCCVWGICLDRYDAPNAELFAKLDAMASAQDVSLSELIDGEQPALPTDREVRGLILTHVRSLGIEPNDDMDIMVVDDSAPGRCTTPPDSIVVGICTSGRSPMELPVEVEDSFRDSASHWDWVWCG